MVIKGDTRSLDNGSYCRGLVKSMVFPRVLYKQGPDVDENSITKGP